MCDKIKTDDIIVVEGKYDRIRVASVVDGVIIETDGFAVFSEIQLKETLKNLAEKHSIIILTDSDAAGFKIRSHIASFLPKDKVKHALIPDIEGKEKRKDAPSKEGKLGVEGIPNDILRDVLMRAGIDESKKSSVADSVKVADLYELGLTGTVGSAARKRAVLKQLSMPQRTGTQLFISIINATMSKEEFVSLVKSIC